MERTRAKILMKSYETNHPYRIAMAKNIVTIHEDLGKNIWGYYTRINRIPSIHVNNRLNGFELNFALSHELGHCVLHPDVNTPFLRKNTLFSIDRIERQANRFALHLMIGFNRPELDETKKCFLLRCGIPEEFHVFY